MAARSALATSTAFQGPVTLPLFKISYSTTATPRSSKQWTHLPNRDSMFVVFDMVRKKTLDGIVMERKLLKLVKEGELLEEIELETLKHQALIMEQDAKSKQMMYDDLLVLVLVKGRLLALRYQLPDGQFRKIQMNFQKTLDCDIAFNTLRSMGLPAQDRSQQSYAAVWRPQSSQGASQVTSQSGSQERTGYLANTYDHILPSGQLFQNQCHRKQARASSCKSQPQERTSGSYAIEYGDIPISNESSQERLRRDSAGSITLQLHSQQYAGAFSSTNHANTPQATRPHQSVHHPVSVSSGDYRSDSDMPVPYIRDARWHHEKFVTGPNSAYNATVKPRLTSSVFSPGNVSVTVPSLLPALVSRPEFGNHSLAFDDEPRPISAPHTQSERFSAQSVTISQMLPPRRILPFPPKVVERASQGPKVTSWLPPPSMASSDTESQSSSLNREARPISEPQTQAERRFIDKVPLSQMLAPNHSLLLLEAKETPVSQCDTPMTAWELNAEQFESKEAETGSLYLPKSPARNIDSNTTHSRRKESLPSPSPRSSSLKAPTKKTLMVTLNTKKPPSSSVPPSTGPHAQERARQVSPRPIDLAFQSSPPVLNASNKRPLTALEESESYKPQRQARREPSSTTPQPQARRFDTALSNTTPAEVLDSVEGWIRKFNHLPAIPEQPRTAKELRAEYAKQSNEARAEAIDNLICECLEDENFIKLAEDVEGAWKRIGLGF